MDIDSDRNILCRVPSHKSNNQSGNNDDGKENANGNKNSLSCIFFFITHIATDLVSYNCYVFTNIQIAFFYF